ncbi:MAG: cell division protein FtsQ [Paracoccaceae bacterium]|jgi:cell division protein FtsQ
MRPLTRSSRRCDPAPSRWAYRVHRLWLTPVFRALLRTGLPAFVLISLVGWYLSDPSRIQQVRDTVHDVRSQIEDRPEFRVNLMAVQGASPELADEIRSILSLDFPVSSFDLDLVDIRARVEGLDAVASADVRIRTGGHLTLSIDEREPVVIWRNRIELVLLDIEGHRVATMAERDLYTLLPIIAGEGAEMMVPEALALVEAARPLADNLRGLVRMGERRWDVVLTDGRRILLPSEDPVRVLERVLAVDDAQDLLARDVDRIDMRLPDRPSIQLTPHALSELRRMRTIQISGEQNG